MTPRPTPLQDGIRCALDCRDSARETLSDAAYAVYVEISLKIYRREAVRLMHGEVLRALGDEGE
jgi:hypothetical protein